MLDELGWQSFSQKRQLIVVYKIITGLEQEPVEGVLISWVTYSGDVFWSYTKDANCHHQFIVCFPLGLDFPLITLPFQGC